MKIAQPKTLVHSTRTQPSKPKVSQNDQQALNSDDSFTPSDPKDNSSPEAMMSDLSRLAKKASSKGLVGSLAAMAIGAAPALAVGVVGGAIGLAIGAISAPLNGIIGATTGAIVGGRIGLSKHGDSRSLLTGLAYSAMGAVGGGVLGFFGSAALSGYAGLQTGVSAAVAGGANLAPIGFAAGQIQGMVSEYVGNKADYPALTQTLSDSTAHLS